MKDKPRLGAAFGNHRLHGAQRQLDRPPIAKRPAHNLAGLKVDNDCQIAPCAGENTGEDGKVNNTRLNPVWAYDFPASSLSISSLNTL